MDTRACKQNKSPPYFGVSTRFSWHAKIYLETCSIVLKPAVCAHRAEEAVHLRYESYCVPGLLVNYLKEVDGDVAEVHREFEKETC